MGLTITNKGGDYESLDAGRYKAICYKIVDAGTRAESYKGGKPKPRTLVYLYWEVTHVQMGDDGDEFWDEIRMEDGRKFTDEEIAGFDITKLLGKTCEFDVVTYQKTDGSSGTAVEGIYKPEGGVKAEETENEQTVFDLDVYAKEFTGESDEESKRMCDVWDDLPDWLKEMIEESFEIKAAREKGGKKDDYRPAAGGLSDFQKDQPDEDEVPF